MTPSIYINLEDDVSKIVDRIKKERAAELILVCPKRCFLFNDSINLRLLKKQVDLIKKSVHILTMDERGQTYAKEAGFNLKFLPKVSKGGSMSDIGRTREPAKTVAEPEIKDPEKIIVKTKELPKPGIRIARPIVKAQAKTVNLEEVVETSPVAQDVLITPQKKADLETQDDIFPSELEADLEQEKKHGGLWKTVLGFLVFSVVLVIVLFLYVLPKGEVIIYPKSESLVRDLEITAGLNIQSPDSTKLVLPGSRVEESVKLTQKFESKGKKEVGSKAVGQVRIYNFTKLPLNLKASTTTLKLANRTYVLSADVNALKPTVYKNAKTKEIDPSSLGGPFEIIASEGGEEANAPGDTRLEITNQVMGSKPQLVYAKTDGPLIGGTSRYLSFVADTDVEEAKKRLAKSTLEKAQEKFKEKNLILAENGYAMDIQSFTTNKPAGSESPSFEATMEVKFSGLAINPKDLSDLVMDRIKQTLAENKTLEPVQSDEQVTFKYKEIDPKYELGVLSVHFQGKVWYNLTDNLSYYPAEFKGKTPEQVNDILSKDLEIDRVDITIVPSWQKTFPKILSSIKIKVEKGQ